MTPQEILWRQYEMSVELIKHYLKLAVEFNVFYYGITGAVVSYYFAHLGQPLMKHALLLPFAMSVLFALFFMYGAYLMGALRKEIFDIRDALKLQTAPEGMVLTAFLIVGAILMIIVAFGLGVLMWGCVNA